MKRSLFAALACACAVGLTGCSGGGGGGSSSPGGGGGGSTATFSGQFKVLAGSLSTSTMAGATQTLQLADVGGKVTSLPSIYSPTAVTDKVIVLKAGSNLLSGHYTSTTVNFTAVAADSGSINLNAAHQVAVDTVLPFNARLTLPIDEIGSLTFPHGVVVNISDNSSTVQVNTLTLSGSADLGGGKATTTLTFDGAGTPNGSAAFNGGDVSGAISMIPFTGPSPYTLNGTMFGPSTAYQSATLVYYYNG